MIAGGLAVAALVVVPLALLVARRKRVPAARRARRAAVPRAGRGRRLDGEPARAALPRDRRRRARLGRAPDPRRRALRPAARERRDGVAARGRDGAVRDPGRVLDVAGQGARADGVLLRAVRAAVRGPARPGVVAAAAAGRLRRAGRAGAGVRRRRLRRVRDAPAAAQPQGDRLERARGVLPRQLAVLRSQHLRPLPRAGDARARRRAAVGAAAAHGRGSRRPRSPCCGAASCSRSRSRASRRCSRVCSCWRRCASPCTRSLPGRRGGDRARPRVRARVPVGAAARPRQRGVARRRHVRALRADARRDRPGRRPPALGLGLRLVRRGVPGARLRRPQRRRVGLAHDPAHGGGGAGPDRAGGLPGAAAAALARLLRRRARRPLPRRRGRRLRRRHRAHLAVRRVPRGPGHVDAAGRRRGAGPAPAQPPRRGRPRGARPSRSARPPSAGARAERLSRRLDLAPQVRDVRAQHPGIVGVRGAPDLDEQRAMGHEAGRAGGRACAAGRTRSG